MTKISMQQADIDYGQQQDCEECPIARAIKRVVKPGVLVKAHIKYIIVGDTQYTTPDVAYEFILEFDQWDKHAWEDMRGEDDIDRPFPISFELPIPPSLLREGVQ